MKKAILILGLFVSLQITAKTIGGEQYSSLNAALIDSQLELFDLEQDLFTSFEIDEVILVEDIEVYEAEEEVNIYEGEVVSTTSLEVGEIEVIELEEEVNLGFNPENYLPTGFDARKGMRCNKNIVVVSLY